MSFVTLIGVARGAEKLTSRDFPSPAEAGHVHPAVIAHPSQPTEQRADKACGNDADCSNETGSGERALVQGKAREAIHLSKNIEACASQPTGSSNQNRHDHGPQPHTQTLLEPVEPG